MGNTQTFNERNISHDYPKPDEHLWETVWRNHGKRPVAVDDKLVMKHHQVRSCLHPDCGAYQIREAPNG